MIKTYVVVLSPDSNLTPSILAEKAMAMGGIELKETCYGLLLEGEEDVMQKALPELRAMDPNRVFFKVRGYRIGDERICRAKRGGGPRPGYHMLSTERDALKNISKALECKDFKLKPDEEKKKINPEDLKKIIETGGNED
ncbi:MAG: methanogenesis marker 6 protein [Candidatus Methanomethylicus sp.]|nr:methanogenesis marker 6 protein [Candidatus Methanomethylicus sp.]